MSRFKSTAFALLLLVLYCLVHSYESRASGREWESMSRSGRLNHVIGYAMGKRNGEQAVVLALCAKDEKSAPCLEAKASLPYNVYSEVTFKEVERIFMFVSLAYAKQEFMDIPLHTLLDKAYFAVMTGVNLYEFENSLRTLKTEPLIPLMD